VRFYSVAVAALAIDAPHKWTDNLLSQHDVAEVAHRRRGVARGITWQALVRIAVIRELHVRLGCAVREAVALTGHLFDSPDEGSLQAGALAIVLDRDALERDLHARLKDALESAPRPRRGRPPVKGRRGGDSAHTAVPTEP
jgi:hypothetical protein